jgi:malate permease and related proteins
MFSEAVIPILKFYVFLGGSYLLFQITPLRERVLKPLLFLTINVFLPLYLIYNFSTGWDEAVTAGWWWMAGFFVASLCFIGIQLLMAKLLINRAPLMKTGKKREMTILFAMHNAGYVPLPIIAALAPQSLVIYLFFFFFAFNISFWTIAVSYLTAGGNKKMVFKPNAPLIGIVAGFIIALLGIYDEFPRVVTFPLKIIGDITLDLILVVLGGILAGIPKNEIKVLREYWGYILYKMILYPVLLFLLMMFLPLKGIPEKLAFGIKLTVVVEALVPPATNNVIAAKAYGTEEQVTYIGNAVIVTYAVSMITIPIFVLLSVVVFG